MDINQYLDQTHYADIEAMGFWEDVNTTKDIHCLCSVTEDDEVVLWHDKPELDGTVVWDKEDEKEYTIPKRAGSLMEGFRYWYKIGQKGGKLSVHNCHTYDKPIIEKVVPKCIIPDNCWIDTFIQSKIQYFDRPCPKGAKSAHGLQAYGIKFGVKKPPITDFKKFDAYILHRVIEDCRIQKKTQEYLDNEASKLNNLGIDFADAYEIEAEYAYNCHKQEIHGVMTDVPHMKRCIEAWDKRTDELAAEIEPLLPPTVKVGSTRVTRSEMMKSLGYTKTPPDETEEVKVDGMMVTKPVKPYYKPSVKFHKTIKTNHYSGFNISYGESPVFTKKNELTKWIKTNHPDTKSKEWGIEKEIKETKVLNSHACNYFEVDELDTDVICGAHTRVSFHESKLTQHDVVKGYLIRYAGLKSVEEWNLKKDGDGQIMRAETFTVVSYPPKAAHENQLHYKIKKGEALVTSPKVGEKDYEQLVGDIGKKIGEYNTTVHRRRFLSNPKDPENKGLMSYLREDGRIPAGVNNFGTSTSRASHRVWVNAAGEGALLGEEIRKCLIAAEGKRLIGADMKSAQLAIAAFFAKNYEYYGAVASGQEVIKDDDGKEIYVGMSAHCHSARNFGLVSQEEFELAVKTQEPSLLHSIALRRKGSKSGSFGVIFGCSGKKLATMLDIPEHEGNDKKDNFLHQMGLHGVADWLKTCKKKYKRGSGWYIPLPCGYWVYCKSDHKAINYVIQGTEAVSQKLAVNWFNKEIITRGIKSQVNQVLDYHDEFLCEANDEFSDKVGELMCEAYKYASDLVFSWYKEHSEYFPNEGSPDFAFNLDGGYKVSELGGKGTYLQTH